MYSVRLFDNTGSTELPLFTDAMVQSWSNRVNGPGRMVFTLPASSANATDENLQKYKRVRLDRRKQDGSGEDETVWYGYIEAHKRTNPAEITVYCAGVLQLFSMRFTTKDQQFNGEGSDDAFDLLDQTNSDDGDTGITAGEGGVTSTASDVKAVGRKDILSMWATIAESHTAEFDITVEGDFRFVPALGSDKTATVTLRYRTDGQPGSTLMDFADGEDGSPLRNKVIGINADGTLESVQEDATSQLTYPVLVEVKVFQEAQDQDTLDALTQAYLDQRKNPIPEFEAKPFLAEKKFDLVTGGRTIEGFQYGAVVPGDLVKCEIITENKNITTNKRVIEIAVDVNAELEEEVSYTLGEEGIFITGNLLASRTLDDLKVRVLTLEQAPGSGGGGGGGGSTAFIKETPTGTIDGSNATFTLSDTPVSDSDILVLNGAFQNDGGEDYTLSGTTITFTIPPPAGSSMFIRYCTAASVTFVKEAPTGSIDGSNSTFTLSHTPQSGSELVVLNAAAENDGGNDYTLSGVTITFVIPPPVGSSLFVCYCH